MKDREVLVYVMKCLYLHTEWARYCRFLNLESVRLDQKFAMDRYVFCVMIFLACHKFMLHHLWWSCYLKRKEPFLDLNEHYNLLLHRFHHQNPRRPQLHHPSSDHLSGHLYLPDLPNHYLGYFDNIQLEGHHLRLEEQQRHLRYSNRFLEIRNIIQWLD